MSQTTTTDLVPSISGISQTTTAGLAPQLPNILPSIGRRQPSAKDLETGPQSNSTSAAADPAASGAAGDADELQNLQKSRALLLGVAVLIALQIITNLFTWKLYSEANKEQPYYQELFFYVGLLVSMSLLVTTSCCTPDAAASCCNMEVFWKRAVGGLAAWTGLCCAVSFGSMVQCFPQICSFYSSVGILGDEKVEFTHIDCPRLLGDVPARVITTTMGHIYAVAAIGVLGGLAVMKPKLSPIIPRVAIDFVDLQDFALLLIDDEILKTFWGQAEEGYGGEWLWWLLFVNIVLALLSMFGDLIYEYATVSDAEVVLHKADPQQTWGTSDNVVNFNSLLFVEVPFLVMRTYTSFRFDVAPSSMVLKNAASICKELWELSHQRHLRLGFYGTVFGTEEQ
jgi:hypothetical protein